MAAVPLVLVGEDGALSIPQSTASLLEDIEDPVAVVSVAGPYRSGKSFLMNCLTSAGGEKLAVPTHFEVGPTVNACTRGLWLFPATVPVRRADGSKVRVLFIDSEGLGAIKSSQQHDLHIVRICRVCAQ